MSYQWPVKPFAQQHPVRGFLCDPRISGGSRSFHTGIDIVAPAGTPVYAVASGKASYGSPADVEQSGGIVVVESVGRNFGYWHVQPLVVAGARVPLHGLLGHVAALPEDWGHVHFAESTHGANGITYWNPLRPGALAPFFDYGPPVLDEIVVSEPPDRIHGVIDLSVRAHDNTPIAVTQPNPPGWRGMPVTPALLRWRLTRGSAIVVAWQVAFDHRVSFHPDVRGNPPSDVNFGAVYVPDTTQNNPNSPGTFHFWLKRRFNTARYRDGTYRLEVEAHDVRGNTGARTMDLTLVNQQSPA